MINLLDEIEKFIKELEGKSSEDFKEMFSSKDGKSKAALFGDFFAVIEDDLAAAKAASKSTDFSDLTKLSDDALFDCLPELLFGDEDMSEAKKTAHIVYEFDMEFGNGGVSQYFANTRGEHTLELAASLEKIGATKYAKACEAFIKKYNIKPGDFDDSIKDYFKVAEGMYPYDELENAIEEFYMNDLLQDYIIKYVRENADLIV